MDINAMVSNVKPSEVVYAKLQCGPSNGSCVCKVSRIGIIKTKSVSYIDPCTNDYNQIVVKM